MSPQLQSTPIVRSFSTDIAVSEAKSKNSHPDTNIEAQKAKATSTSSVKQLTIKEQPSALEDDICSTDSSVLDENDVKKKKRKLFTFTKKNKNKAD